MILYYYLLTHIPVMLWMGIRTRLLVQVLVRRLKVEGFLYLQSSETLRIVPVDEAPVQGTFFFFDFGLVFISVWVAWYLYHYFHDRHIHCTRISIHNQLRG
jgi:hypothetical protein